MKKVGETVIIAVILVLVSFFPGILINIGESAKESGIGGRFHRETSLTWAGAIGDIFSRKPDKPPQYKNYPDAQKIKLPEPKQRGMPLEDTIRKRRSVRDYSSRAITMDQLSQILFAAQGITGSLYGSPLRSAPSAGALYPFEIYLVVNNVKNLSSGIYHYSILDHSIEFLKVGDFSSQITNAGLKQEMLGDSGVTFVLSAIFDRIRHKYGERGYRYVYIEAGHISQNISLQAVSLGIGSVSVGAFLDENVNRLIGIDGTREAVIYLHAVGSP
jgi:SagB-type dehydrogenase family enzyme